MPKGNGHLVYGLEIGRLRFPKIITAPVLGPQCQQARSTGTALQFLPKWRKPKISIQPFLNYNSHLNPASSFSKSSTLSYMKICRYTTWLEAEPKNYPAGSRTKGTATQTANEEGGTRTELDIIILKVSTENTWSQAASLFADTTSSNLHIWKQYTCVPSASLCQTPITSWARAE